MKSNNKQEKHYKISINNDKKKLDSEKKLNLESQSIIEKNKAFHLIKINASKLKIDEKTKETAVKKNLQTIIKGFNSL